MARRKFVPGKKLLTDDERSEIVLEYLEWMTPMRILAERYGVSITTIHRILAESKALEEAGRKADSRAQIALIRLKNASADAADKLVALMEKERSDKQVYADIQIIQQVLDRAGVRAKTEEKQELDIRFNTGGITLGVPDHSKDE